MLLDLKALKDKYNLDIQGVIHVGAHFGEELPIYQDLGVKALILIEPNTDCLSMIQANLQSLPEDSLLKKNTTIFNVALGNKMDKATLYNETANQGQSNSLLKPKKHLEYYPDIQFTSEKLVQVERLDDMGIAAYRYNFMNLDIQGFEKQALMGSSKTILNHIDYIYTEVNTEELYEGCTKLEELDELLGNMGFYRSELSLTNAGWGDALYIRKSNMVEVPPEFKIPHPFEYPKGNRHEFERWFYDKVSVRELRQNSRIYLPIFWTAYYVKHNYGTDLAANRAIQTFIDNLPRNKKYFTICQYDDGPMVDFGNLDIKVFGMGGGRVDIPIPLIWDMPKDHRPLIHPNTAENKTYTYNFIGRETHPIRRDILNSPHEVGTNYVSSKEHNYIEYTSIIAQSKFTLCPRGYGKTSFRIAEALKYGSIPVYISDEFLLPYGVDFLRYGLQYKDFKSFLKALPQLSKHYINNLLFKTQLIYENLFTYEACKNIILETLQTI